LAINQISVPNATLHNNHAIAYYYLGLYSYAIEDFTQAVQISGSTALIHHNRGLTFQLLGMAAQANSDFTIACQLDAQYC
jgi:tetratricopeptide (TPR) repeat protein